MITKTHRQYLKPSIVELEANFRLYNLAESLVDDYVGVKSYAQIDGKAIQFDLVFIAAEFLLTPTTLTITGKSYSKNTFKYCVIEVLEGANEGLIIPVTSSLDNVLTLATDTALSFTAFRIYQLGNFPRVMDTTGNFKYIKQEIVDATKMLFDYLVENETVITGLNLKSESQSTSSYSYALADNSQNLLLPITVTQLLNKFL